jgi:hypothetical protein
VGFEWLGWRAGDDVWGEKVNTQRGISDDEDSQVDDNENE